MRIVFCGADGEGSAASAEAFRAALNAAVPAVAATDAWRNSRRVEAAMF